MLKIRNFLLPAVLVLVLTPVFRFVSAKTEVISNPSMDPASAIRGKTESIHPLEAPGTSNPARLDACADMLEGVGSVVACRNPGRIATRPEAPGPAYPARFGECVDMPGVVGSVVACRNASQIPVP